MKRYTASVVGGGSGGRLSLDALAASERYELVAAADISPAAREALAKEYPSLRVFGSHRAMFADCPTDVVCVSTWAPSHLAVTRHALQLPLQGILVEKPLAETAAAGEEILRAVKARGIPMVTPHGLLTAAHSLEILRLVREGAIGRLRLVEIECTRWDIINAGIHWLDYFVHLTPGDPVATVLAACDASTRTYRDGMQVETLAVTQAVTRGGVRVMMVTGDSVPVTREGKGTLFRLIGDAGLIEFWGWESAYRLQNAQHPGGEVVAVPPAPVTGHRAYVEGLARQMDAGESDYAIPESSLAALEICEAAYLSDRWGTQVSLPLARFTPPAPSTWAPGQPYSGHGGGRDGRKLG